MLDCFLALFENESFSLVASLPKNASIFGDPLYRSLPFYKKGKPFISTERMPSSAEERSDERHGAKRSIRRSLCSSHLPPQKRAMNKESFAPIYLSMNVLEAFIIGIVQGLTEFLPISSSGHILLVERIMGVQSELSFTLVLHLATLIAVVIVMRKRIYDTIRAPKKWLPLILATIFSALVVFALGDLIEPMMSGSFLAICFLITAIMLLVSGFIKPKKKEVNTFDAVIIGIVQGLAVIPGISRSGSTVSTAVMLGNEKEESVSFSFLLSIPIIIASAAIDLLTEGISSVPFLPLLTGFIAAFFSGLFAVKFMLKVTRSYDGFAVYLAALSAFASADSVSARAASSAAIRSASASSSSGIRSASVRNSWSTM